MRPGSRMAAGTFLFAHSLGVSLMTVSTALHHRSAPIVNQFLLGMGGILLLAGATVFWPGDCAPFVLNSTSLQLIPAYSSQSSSFEETLAGVGLCEFE